MSKYCGLHAAKIGDQRLPGRQGAIFDGEVLAIVLLSKGKHVGQTGGLNAGYVFHLVDQAPIEGGLFAIAFVEIVGGQTHAKRQHMIGPDAHIHVLQIFNEALHRQSGADQQHAGKSDLLSSHQQTPHSRPARREGSSSAARLQRIAHAGASGMEGRNQSENQRGPSGD